METLPVFDIAVTIVGSLFPLLGLLDKLGGSPKDVRLEARHIQAVLRLSRAHCIMRLLKDAEQVILYPGDPNTGEDVPSAKAIDFCTEMEELSFIGSDLRRLVHRYDRWHVYFTVLLIAGGLNFIVFLGSVTPSSSIAVPPQASMLIALGVAALTIVIAGVLYYLRRALFRIGDQPRVQNVNLLSPRGN
ncbi:MAG: hypothetical protein OXI50_03710 [Gammaproteobacteria bacterium]|nr:hypothetical protein [Gammaproteobacteria bacterium]